MVKNHICKLCLFDAEEYNLINLFGEESKQLNINNVIVQHFWFFNSNEKIDNHLNFHSNAAICLKCWKIISDFHAYYKHIENIHKQCTKSIVRTTTTTTTTITTNTQQNNNYNDKNYYDENILKDIDIGGSNDIIIKPEISHSPPESELEEQFVINYSDGIPFIDVTSFLDHHKHDQQLQTLPPSPENTLDEIKSSEELKDIIISSTENLNVNENDQLTIQKEEEEEEASNKQNNENITNDNLLISSYKHQKNINNTLANKKYLEDDIKLREFYNIVCTVCNAKKQTFSDLKLHYNTKHNVRIGYVLCCNRKLSRREVALEHMNWHINPSDFKCQICQKDFTSARNIKMHMNLHTKPEERKFRCDICNNSFTELYLLKRHFRWRHIKRKTDNIFECDLCTKSYKNSTSLGNHKNMAHKQKDNHVCHVCAKEFKTKSQYKWHYFQHLNVEKPKFQCKHCSVFMDSIDRLKYHVKITHTNVISECKLCGKITPHKASLRNHMYAVHGERLHKCNLCEKSFTTPTRLKEHMATHTGRSYLYSCEYCLLAFNSKSNMYKHRKNKHPNEWLAKRSK